mmetsp:Transcript_65589/g.97118  ORF Transcript_65589/g.97118 Transcript_65589/m.97118 type:complete len:368 (-) Transcript_65589:241-1344(-)
MMENVPSSSSLDHIVLRIGLDAAELTKDPKLAHDVISWAWRSRGLNKADEVFSEDSKDFLDTENNYPNTDDGIHYNDSDPNVWRSPESSPEKVSHHVHVPPQAYLRAIRLCVAGDEVDLARNMLEHCSKADSRIPETLIREMYTLVMAGYAKGGHVDDTKQLLSEMQNKGPRPSEKAYGAVIHALAMNKKVAEASEIIESMLSNDYGDGVKPGPSSFASCMLSLVHSKDWEGVLSLNEKMIDSGIPFNSTIFQGVMLAYHRLGNRQRALEIIEQACQTELAMDSAVFQTCIRVFLPNEFENTRISPFRKELRLLGEKEPNLASVALNLSRSLRVAELNKNRQMDIQRHCWNDAIKNLIEYIRKKDTH